MRQLFIGVSGCLTGQPVSEHYWTWWRAKHGHPVANAEWVTVKCVEGAMHRAQGAQGGVAACPLLAMLGGMSGKSKG